MPRNKARRSVVPLGCVDHGALLRALVRDTVLVAADDFTSYDVSYPEFLKYFNSCGPLRTITSSSRPTLHTDGCQPFSISPAASLRKVWPIWKSRRLAAS